MKRKVIPINPALLIDYIETEFHCLIILSDKQMAS